MNYLAHAFLSCGDGDLLLGNFIADYIRKNEDVNYSKRIREGIELHRKIDFYTDNHDIVRQGTKRLHKRHHKYAPVVIDILYDYLLSTNWNKYSGEELQDFANGVYEVFQDNKELLPDTLKGKIDKMIGENFLLLYTTKEGLAKSMNYMDRRTKFPSNFKDALLDLEEHEEAFHREFNQFFPDVINYIDEQCNC